jgi:hypothetical protein
VEWKKDWISTLLRGTQESRRVATLFQLEAICKAHEGRSDEALAWYRGMLNAGRSVGDEPTPISQLVRNAVDGLACQNLVRILAQGAPTEWALAKVQQGLAEEIRDIQPLPRFALKAERGGFFNAFGLIAAGDMRLEDLIGGRSRPPNWLESAWSWLWVRPVVRMNQAVYLEKMTQAIAIARLPATEWQEAFAQFQEEIAEFQRASPHQALALLAIPAIGKVLTAHQRACAKLDCARTAVAAERYRLAHGRWPQSLDELVPKYLEEVPRDVFGKGPLRCRRLKDGLLIYSVGPDGEDEPDEADDQEVAVEGPKADFRLWDAAHRGRR